MEDESCNLLPFGGLQKGFEKDALRTAAANSAMESPSVPLPGCIGTEESPTNSAQLAWPPEPLGHELALPPPSGPAKLDMFADIGEQSKKGQKTEKAKTGLQMYQEIGPKSRESINDAALLVEHMDWQAKLMDVFDQLDLDRSGSIDVNEFSEALPPINPPLSI